jgi:hypothetical protein
MTSERDRGAAVLVAAGTLIIASIFLYRVRPLVGTTFGSGAIVLAVLVHLGLLADIVGPFVAWRRRRRRQ